MTRPSRHVGRRGALVVGLAVGVLASVAVPLARASTYTYCNGLVTNEGQVRTSGQRSTVSGGSASVALGFGTQYIITYYPPPGGYDAFWASGNAPALTTLAHATQSLPRSKCYWYWAGQGGSAHFTCQVYS
ncbi:exported hypothetical protein [Nostocoides japonicum T1-X7]|uniref:Uncharacterized protein n=1 Tax=Nostocoides japonicum T1-X7 TaxID=1194083 RepID=A0A077LSM5_9MICO|nr:exported hypothetical protein [Tetrasphaera japonica T1-X7]